MGRYKITGGREVSIREGFAMSRTEVTLGQYKSFLDFPDHRRFQHPEQPVNKKNHKPNDWDVVWPAAVRGKTWLGRAMTIECPVVGIDWWDAYAYAQWSQGRLPTLSEWVVASEYEGQSRKVSLWGPVGHDQMDVTGAGFAGMAGSVREWTAVSEINPGRAAGAEGLRCCWGLFRKSGWWDFGPSLGRLPQHSAQRSWISRDCKKVKMPKHSLVVGIVDF